MKKKWTTLLILMICACLAGCGSNTDGEDTQEVSALADEQTDDATDADEESVADTADNESEANAEIESEEQASTDNSEADDETEEPVLPDYEVTELEEPIIMYTSDSLNVRQGPSTDFEIIGFLKSGRVISVIGQADTGWYQIIYNEEKAFVCNDYVLAELPVEESAPELVQDTEPVSDDQPQETAAVEPVTEVKNVAGVILVGDSRFVQMKNSVGDNPCTWIAESSKGYKWLNENAIARIDNCVGNGSKILINLGVNDPGNLQKYLTLINAKAEEWTSKGATVYYSSVNPVWENPYVTEEQVEYFNAQLQSGLSEKVHWIDSHSYLNSIGYRLVDGLHYSSETYQNLYAYYMSCL